MVTDHHLFGPLIEAGVDMKGNVTTSQKVHCEPVEDQKQRLLLTHLSLFNPYVHFVWRLQLNFNHGNKNIEIYVLYGGKRRVPNITSLHFSIRFDMAQDSHHHLVIDAPGQIQVIWHTLPGNNERIIIQKRTVKLQVIKLITLNLSSKDD